MEKLVLIDGHSIIHRAFYGVPDLTNSEGLHTNAVYGFLNIMFKILDEEKADKLIVAFDVSQPTFRHEMYEPYKGTRKPMPEELRQQVPLLKEVLSAMDIMIAELPGYEADDVIGTLSVQGAAQGYEVTVVSGDRDLLQLADTHVQIRIPKTKKGTTEIENYYPEQVMEKYLVSPKSFIDVKALMGDTSDNIPGVPSIGEKTATKLIHTYDSLEGVYEHIDEVKPERIRLLLIQHKELALLSQKLATIQVHAPIEKNIAEANIAGIYSPAAFEELKRLEFKSLLGRFQIDTQENEIEQHFSCIHELADAEKIFAKLQHTDVIGLYPVIEGQLLGLAAAWGEQQTVYLPVEGFLSSEYLLDKIRQLADGNRQLVFIDLKSALSVLQLPAEGSEEAEHYDDVAIGSYLLNPLKDTYNYDDIARDYLGMIVPSKTELIDKLSYQQAAEQKPDAYLKCVCYGAYIAYASLETIVQRLQTEGMYELYRSIEMPTLFVLSSMENYGIRVKETELKAYGTMLGEKIKLLEQDIYAQVGEEFNINSPKQLGEILFGKMKLKGGKKTKTGYSTSAEVLEKLAPDYPVIRSILQYRQLTKLKSTYADGLTAYISEDGRIHGKFNQTITATGRISSTEPNLQNIPIRMELGKAIRKVFVPEEGYVFIDADYSQIELRVLAHISGDENLIEAYQSAQDIHRITAAKVFHTPLEEVTDLQRRNAKAVNFGIVYGISSFGLSQDLSISKKEAAVYIEQYFQTYPKIKEFLDRTVEEAKKNGYVTTMLGRKRPIPELFSSNFMQRSFGERIAMNSPIQGTAADIIKIAMIRVQQQLWKEKLKSRLVLQVHDELLIEAYQEELEQVKEIVAREMRNAANLRVSLEIDLGTGNDWLEAH